MWRECLRMFGLLTVFCFTLVSCITIGHPFPVDAVSKIRLGQTTQEDIEEMFGTPWRTGIEDGYETWTYGRYRYTLWGGASTCDLVVKFNKQHVVISYSFNTTE